MGRTLHSYIPDIDWTFCFPELWGFFFRACSEFIAFHDNCRIFPSNNWPYISGNTNSRFYVLYWLKNRLSSDILSWRNLHCLLHFFVDWGELEPRCHQQTLLDVPLSPCLPGKQIGASLSCGGKKDCSRNSGTHRLSIMSSGTQADRNLCFPTAFVVDVIFMSLITG